MICKQCGATISDQHRFCPYCGNTMSVSAPQPTPAVSQSKLCFKCGATMAQDGRFCSVCGQDNAPSAAPTPVTPAAPTPSVKKKKKHGLAITLSSIAAVLIIALLVGWLTNWFGFYGPGAQILNAVENTFTAGSFTSEITITDGDRTEKYYFEMEIDFDNEDLSVVVADNSDQIIFAIYDGYGLYYSSYNNCYYKQNLRSQIDQIFETYESTSELDFEDILEMLDDDYGINCKEIFDVEKLEESAKDMDRNLNSDSWLKQNAGYSKSKENGITVYNFKPNICDLTLATLAEFEDSFEDEDVYLKLTEEAEEHLDDFDDMDFDISIGVANSELSFIDYSSKTNGIRMDFMNIGTTVIDTSLLKQIMNIAK